MTDDPMRLAIFGAGGKTGQEIVSQAAAKGHEIRAIEPEWPTDPEVPQGVETVTGDLLNDDLAPLIEGCDAVISAIGLGLSASSVFSPPPLYTKGTERLIEAMSQAGISRIVVVSASFVASRDRGPVWFRATAGLALDNIFSQMGEMERLLRASDLDWTAVRPGWLLDAPLTGDYRVTPEVIDEDVIRTRHADLAHFMIACAEDGAWSRQTPAVARQEPDSASTPDKLLADMGG